MGSNPKGSEPYGLHCVRSRIVDFERVILSFIFCDDNEAILRLEAELAILFGN